ncbi:unnamed protein product, partial [Polarella glacialis]
GSSSASETSSTGSEGLSRASSASPLCSDSSQDLPSPASVGVEAEKMDRDMWYIHGNCYDLAQFVPKHPGGHLAILSGRGRDCTNLFESYHPWNDKHRKVLKAYGAAPPAPDPFYEELKEKVRAAFPGGGPSTRMRPQ